MCFKVETQSKMNTFRLIKNVYLLRSEALGGAKITKVDNEHPSKVNNKESERLSTAWNTYVFFKNLH